MVGGQSWLVVDDQDLPLPSETNACDFPCFLLLVIEIVSRNFVALFEFFELFMIISTNQNI
ncbi:hypothetical protein ES708_33977 [subsurface metagenome]